jgi:hypothetical protein
MVSAIVDFVYRERRRNSYVGLVTRYVAFRLLSGETILNCWDSSSARTTGSQRSVDFRRKVIKYYQRASKSEKQVKCQVLDELTPRENAGTIVAGHIWKASTRGKGLADFGLQASDVNSPRNGLFLTKGIEEAFDNQQVCFLYHLLQSRLLLWVADAEIREKEIDGSTLTFAAVHLKPLLCPKDRSPYRRLLSWHARLTLELRKESLPLHDFTSVYDNLPGRDHARNKIDETIDALVEPGDDASVRNVEEN